MPAWLLPALTMGAQAGLGIYGQWKAQQHDENLANAQQGWNRSNMNYQNQWNLDQWNRQNRYNLELWNMQNEYNSPQAQMARYKAAGLNPHLIYGQGTPGNAPNMPATSATSAADVKGYTRAQSRNIMQGVDQFDKIYTMANTKAQTDNIKTLTDLNRTKALGEATNNLIKLQKLKSDTRGNIIGESTLYNTIDLQNMQLAKIKADIRSMDAGTMNKEIDYDFKAGSLNSRLDQELSKAGNLWRTGFEIKQRTKGIVIANALKKLESEMLNKGVTPSDDIFFRQLYQNEKTRPYLQHAVYTDKGINTIKDFLRFLKVDINFSNFGKGRGNRNPYPNNNNRFKPNTNFFNE